MMLATRSTTLQFRVGHGWLFRPPSRYVFNVMVDEIHLERMIVEVEAVTKEGGDYDETRVLTKVSDFLSSLLTPHSCARSGSYPSPMLHCMNSRTTGTHDGRNG